MISVHYSASSLDRASHLRRDPNALADMLATADKGVTLYWREMSLIDQGTTSPTALLARGQTADALIDQADCVIFLGLDPEDHPIFAADISGMPGSDAASPPEIVPHAQWHSLRLIGGLLPEADSSLLAYARALSGWNARHKFCGLCGAAAESREGGHVRVCSNPQCGAVHYPRTDPAVIMRVTDGDRVLLHRQPSWPTGQWSILAGFVEPGETLEAAVAREVLEETAIIVDDVVYAGCQPWPFPSSLMVAFSARAIGGVLTPDPHELEDARWFDRRDILRDFHDSHRQTGQGLFLPRPDSIARRMLEDWLKRP